MRAMQAWQQNELAMLEAAMLKMCRIVSHLDGPGMRGSKVRERLQVLSVFLPPPFHNQGLLGAFLPRVPRVAHVTRSEIPCAWLCLLPFPLPPPPFFLDTQMTR